MDDSSLTEFQFLAQRLFGPEPINAAIRFLDVAPRSARRWGQGEPAPEGVIQTLREELERVEAAGAYAIAADAFNRMLDAGLDPETAAGVMRTVAQDMRKKS